MDKIEKQNTGTNASVGVETLVMPKYQYLLHFWGEIMNNNLVERELKISGNYCWFDSSIERQKAKEAINNIAKKYNVVVAFSEEEGNLVRYKTVAKMILRYKNKDYELDYDFGYGYPAESAMYMFRDGNYSCDCNKSLFLADKYPDDFKDEFECGDKIQIIKFTIKYI